MDMRGEVKIALEDYDELKFQLSAAHKELRYFKMGSKHLLSLIEQLIGDERTRAVALNLVKQANKESRFNIEEEEGRLTLLWANVKNEDY
jgi:hypothetical protein